MESYSPSVGDGELWSFGFGSFGQLGHGDFTDQLLPKKVMAFEGKYVQGITAGSMHSFALVNGELFSFGNDIEGELGHGDPQHQTTPKKIAAFDGKRVWIPRPKKIVRRYWFPREKSFFAKEFEERDEFRGGLVVGICRVWGYHGVMWKGMDEFFFELVSYFCE